MYHAHPSARHVATVINSGYLFSAGSQEGGDWCETPGLMGIAHGLSQLEVYVRLFFPFEVWKEWGSYSCSSSF